jgi:manganese-dependent inorganic pyrophosphatase
MVRDNSDKVITYVCGHRNPDVDSVMSAYALADLRKRMGMSNVEPLCVGKLPAKAKWVFNHYNIKHHIRSKRDVYVRVADIVEKSLPIVDGNISLEEALRILDECGESSLPVKCSKTGKLAGMLAPAKLISYFVNKSDLSIPVSEAPLRKNSLVLCTTDRVSDIKNAAIRNARNHFPVVDEHGILVGTVLKRAFAEKPPFRMILVDHNEFGQGIPGGEELPVIEVVDHHRIAFVTTKDPIKYTADVVGATCTLVAQMFRGAGITPSKDVCIVLLAGIVADTLLFQSPTTTEVDRQLAKWLETHSGVMSEDIMRGLMSVHSPLTSMPAEQAISIDAKEYSESGRKFILAQIEESHMQVFHKKIEELKSVMAKTVASNGVDFMALMVTDPVVGNSELIIVGNDSISRSLPYRKGEYGTLLMPGVLSRKMQLLPEIIDALS